MKEYFFIKSKTDDNGKCAMAVIYAERNIVAKNTHYNEVISKKDYEILAKYIENVNKMDYEDFGYETLKDYLEENFKW